MPEPIVDYAAWDNFRRSAWSKPQNVPLRYFTATGRAVYKKLREFVRRPDFKGCSKDRMYFKWKVFPHDDMMPFMAFTDWLRDMDYDVQLCYKTGLNFKDRNKPHAYLVVSVGQPFVEDRFVLVYRVTKLVHKCKTVKEAMRWVDKNGVVLKYCIRSPGEDDVYYSASREAEGPLLIEGEQGG